MTLNVDKFTRPLRESVLLQLSRHQFLVETLLLQQFRVRTLLDNHTTLDDQHLVGVFHSGETVSNDQYSTFVLRVRKQVV